MRFVYAAMMVAGSTLPALAQHEPVIVIPGRPDVPVIINGYDASGTVVEGDWGLERPGQVAPTIVDGPLIPVPYYARGDYLYGRGYYPATGKRPGYGRHEIEPPANRALPPPAPSFHREYGIESAPNPVTEYPPYDMPGVVVAPDSRRRDVDAPRGDDQGNSQPSFDGSQGDNRKNFDASQRRRRGNVERSHDDHRQNSDRHEFDGSHKDGEHKPDGKRDADRHGRERSQDDGRNRFDRTQHNAPHGFARAQSRGKVRTPHRFH